MVKMAWDLLLVSWLWVAAVMRLAMPSSKSSTARLPSVTMCCERSDCNGTEEKLKKNIENSPINALFPTMESNVIETLLGESPCERLN